MRQSLYSPPYSHYLGRDPNHITLLATYLTHRKFATYSVVTYFRKQKKRTWEVRAQILTAMSFFDVQKVKGITQLLVGRGTRMLKPYELPPSRIGTLHPGFDCEATNGRTGPRGYRGPGVQDTGNQASML